MLNIPSPLQAQFVEWLRNRAVANSSIASYLKWLRYYLDFCEKYHFPNAQTDSIPHFLGKLQQKKQTEAQQREAVHAIKLYQELLQDGEPENQFCSPQERIAQGKSAEKFRPPADPPLKRDNGAGKGSARTHSLIEPLQPAGSTPRRAVLSHGTSWKAEYARLSDEIKLRHYSPKTLRTYAQWVRHYQTFTRSQDPNSLSTQDVKEFLTHLAVDRKVSASTQNQAFNALLFFHRHVLNKEFGKVEGVVRAKRKPYIPVVLCREEIHAVLKQLAPPFNLVVKLLYGCGLRLFECLHLRVQCFNFDAEVLTVHDGKGQKDRTVPLPKTILPELRIHLESLKELHQRPRQGLRWGLSGECARKEIPPCCEGIHLAVVFSRPAIDPRVVERGAPPVLFA
jgi:site-specific recombinase XerD